MLIVTGHFSDGGIALPTLSPIIKIWDIGGAAVVVPSAAMVPVGDGFYRYNFAGYDPAKTYGFVIDGGATLIAAKRFIYGGISNFSADVMVGAPTGSVGFN